MNKYFAEFIGTFILVSVILNFPSDNPIYALAVGLSLAVAIFVAGKFSGGHFNPAVSIAKYVQGDINSTDVILYPLAQIIGGLVAYLLHSGKTGLMKDSSMPDNDMNGTDTQPILLSDSVVNMSNDTELNPEPVQGETVQSETVPTTEVNEFPSLNNEMIDANNVSASNQAGGIGLSLMDNLDNTPIYA